MFYRLSALAIMASLHPAAAASAADAFPSGVWANPEQEVQLRIAPCAARSDAGGRSNTSANRFCGTVLQDNRPGPAANPPNHILVRDLVADGGGWKGKIVDGGTILNFTMRPATNDRALARYCFGFVCETETWVRSTTTSPQDSVSQR